MFREYRAYFILFVLLFEFINLNAQNSKIEKLYDIFSVCLEKGDFVTAERSLKKIYDSKDSLTYEYKIATFNNLGVLNIRLGRFVEALNYLNQAEVEIGKKPAPQELADVYVNKARVYGILKEPDKAIEYLYQAIKIYSTIKTPDKSHYFRISSAYLNLGLTYFEKNDYSSALDFLNKSIEIKLQHNLSEIALPYLNVAKTYSRINQIKKAQIYFDKSINSMIKEFGKDYFKLAEVYYNYGIHLSSIGSNNDALDVHKKALLICLKNYGDKHTLTSLAYKQLGDSYLSTCDYQAALKYYQKSIIAVVNNFSDTSFYSNPTIDSVIFDIRLLNNLKQKAIALELLSQNQIDLEKKQQLLDKGFETIDLALRLIARIRSGYVSIESKIYLAENEKETYIFATHLAHELYGLTADEEYLQKMYSIASQSKSAILRNEISENERLYRILPDSLHVKRNELFVNIASYSKLIQDEQQKVKPDLSKIDLWKSILFELKRDKEKSDQVINSISPEFQTLLHKTDPTSLNELQSNLEGNEIIIDYLLSNSYKDGKRELFIFTITKKEINCKVTYLDSLFIHNIESIKLGVVNNPKRPNPQQYADYTNALYCMYDWLIRPIEPKLRGKKLIIVPDEELALLPFDAFLRNLPDSSQNSYDGLQYLVYDYSISYSYVSSLIFKAKNNSAGINSVYAFSPDYSRLKRDSGSDLNVLKGSKREADYIFKWLKGQSFSSGNATKSNFKRLADQQAIFHLAMHSDIDSSNSNYTSLIFDYPNDSVDNGKLFNYEIGLLNMKSPMVVLSACNTGNGNLYHGEGVNSLARGFILAGASSVVNTFWDVNDDASSTIMGDFYYNLSTGAEKGDALRMAKLNYIKNATPTYANPYYWAAYEVMGDKSSLKSNSITVKLLGGIGLIGLVAYAFYRKRSRIV